MIEMSLEADGVNQKLQIVAEGIDNLTQAMIDAAEASFKFQKDENFDHSGNRGTPWRDLAESTKKIKKKEGKIPYQILVDGGDLRQKWQTSAITKNHVIFGTAIPYAATHQYGTDRIPARPFLPNTEADMENFKSELQAVLAKSGIPAEWKILTYAF